MDLTKINPRNVVRAITLCRPYGVVYCAKTPDGWLVQCPDKSEPELMEKKAFDRRFCLESDCPPRVKELFSGVQTFSQWRKNKFGGQHA